MHKLHHMPPAAGEIPQRHTVERFRGWIDAQDGEVLGRKGNDHLVHRPQDAFKAPFDAFHFDAGLAPLGDIREGGEDGWGAAALDDADLHFDERIAG